VPLDKLDQGNQRRDVLAADDRLEKHFGVGALLPYLAHDAQDGLDDPLRMALAAFGPQEIEHLRLETVNRYVQIRQS